MHTYRSLAFWSFLVTTLLLAPPAFARELHVTLLMATGSPPITYTIPEEEIREFWTRWLYLPETEQMVPLGQPSGYHGLTVRDDEQNKSARLFNGVGAVEGAGAEARLDTGRQLERWVLAKAPPPMGPVLLRALEDEMAKAPSAIVQPSASPRAGIRLIRECQTRAHGNLGLRISCLEEQLEKQLGTEAYLTELEKITTPLEARPASPVNP